MPIIPRMGEWNTHVTGVMVHLRKKIHDLGKPLLDLAPDGHMVAPGVALLLLGYDIPKIYRIKPRAKIFLFKVFIVEFKPS